MESWVRYSVAVYLGLALAGALIAPKPEAAAWCSSRPNVSPEMRRAAAEEAEAKRRGDLYSPMNPGPRGIKAITSGRAGRPGSDVEDAR